MIHKPVSPPDSELNLLADSSVWSKIQQDKDSDILLRQLHDRVLNTAHSILELPTLCREMQGRRLLHISRAFLKRALFLGAAYRLTDNEAFAQKLTTEARAVADFSDWNPSHFLDTAEMSLGMAVVLDWIRPALSPETREILAAALLEKGLKAGMTPNPQPWYFSGNNWNQVCFGGMLAAALVLRERNPEMLDHYLGHAAARVWHALEAYAPDGAYVEGPGYWDYGTHFSVITIEMLRRHDGDDLGIARYPGFLESARYLYFTRGPSGLSFNFSDGEAALGFSPALFWFATECNDSQLAEMARERVHNGPEWSAEGESHRLAPLALLWHRAAQTEALPWPLNWRARGANPLGVLRSSWEPDALFFAIKGGKPSNNHGHMDVGSFVLDADGVRWAEDLGAQDYHSLEQAGLNIWDKSQASDRWKVFRLGNESHNTLWIGPEGQWVDAFATLVLDPALEGPDSNRVQVDLGSMYPGRVSRARRRAQLCGSDRLRLTDELEGLAPGQALRWQWLTRAAVEISDDGRQAEMRLGGRQARLTIAPESPGRFVSAPADPPNSFDCPNPGITRIDIPLVASEPELRLEVVFSR